MTMMLTVIRMLLRHPPAVEAMAIEAAIPGLLGHSVNGGEKKRELCRLGEEGIKKWRWLELLQWHKERI